MKCDVCKHRKHTLCKNPKNLQPRFRQYDRVKQLSKANFPNPPNWCKGFTPNHYVITLQEMPFTVPCPTERPNWECD
jgi:hypothetical protein